MFGLKHCGNTDGIVFLAVIVSWLALSVAALGLLNVAKMLVRSGHGQTFDTMSSRPGSPSSVDIGRRKPVLRPLRLAPPQRASATLPPPAARRSA